MTALDIEQQLTDRITAPDFQQWRAKVYASGGCAKPIRLTGSGMLVDPDGTIIYQRSGELFAPCGNRRGSVCPSCSDRYAADAFHLIRAGLSGGHKHVPTCVTEKPRVFLTLTPPSFGPVHTRRTTRTGTVIPCGCTQRHHPDDPRIGAPLDPDSYDYVGSVLWQAHAGQLWHRFTIALRRALAQHLGIPGRLFSEYARVSYAKVAEYQRRGLVHFHAAIRIDGPDGPANPCPPGITPAVLRESILEAARAACVTVIRPDGGALHVEWGAQLDIRDITRTAADQIEDPTGQISEARLAGYIAKYATKGTGKTEAADRPIHSEHEISYLKLTPHHRRMIETVWELGGLDQYQELNLRRWAHMLGFRGHFLTKSQRYSTTFGAIREERHLFQIAYTLNELGHEVDDLTEVLVVNDWRLIGIGHRDEAEKELAQAIGERARHLPGEQTRREEYR
ncbi:MAG: replication initiation protein [Actinomycetota bacterium]|nr:replication initiation protein [Actinomycetota bacterium]